MKAIRAGIILENAARLAGRDAIGLGIPAEWRVLAEMSINACMTRIVAEKFPMMMRTEFRRYRPKWKSATYAAGNEVWLDGRYWRAETATGGTPGESTDWTELAPEQIAAFIAWDQPWENTVIHRAGIDPARFAYRADPKYSPNATPVRTCRITAFGAELEAPAPREGVYCCFIPETPRISFDEFNSAMTYEPGDVVYVSSTKDCYVCLVTEPGTPTDGNGGWQPVRIPGEFETYMTRAVSVDFMSQDQGKQLSTGYAEQEFNRLCEMYHEGNGETQMRRGRFM